MAISGVLSCAAYTTSVVSWTEKHVSVFGDTDPFPRENYVQKRVVVDKNIITAQGTAFIEQPIFLGFVVGLYGFVSSAGVMESYELLVNNETYSKSLLFKMEKKQERISASYK